MKIAVTGASGFVGTALCNHLRSQKHLVLPMVRGKSSAQPSNGRAGSIYWNPDKAEIDAGALEGVEAVIHLAGESIAAGRWTEGRKNQILRSRVEGTRLIASTLTRLTQKPRVLISASAIGFYGERGEESLDENSSHGSGFLADVCKQWEDATEAAESSGIRVAHARLGVVLGRGGGAMTKMLPLFNAGLGGILGSGRQYWSWISLHDLCRAFAFVLESDIHGPVNFVGPNPATNKAFTEELARAVHKPAFLPAPAFALRAALGEMADEMLLASQKVQPRVLLDNGFQFEQPQLAEALATIV